MSEFRQNPITKNWVLIAPSRGKRPDQFATYSVMHGIPEVDAKCIFCPKNEHLNKGNFPALPWTVELWVQKI